MPAQMVSLTLGSGYVGSPILKLHQRRLIFLYSSNTSPAVVLLQSMLTPGGDPSKRRFIYWGPTHG